MFGFLNVYKPSGMTSFDVVTVLRRITKMKQIGHTGTLDPFATGVLPVCIGKATKLIEYLPDDKEYIASVKFGADTDTYDLEGQIVKTYDRKIKDEELKSALKSFEGEIEQYPPKYSAIKVNGKKLYEYARSGQDIKIEPRMVKIYEIELVNFDYDAQIAKIRVSCSKGTYIRSIAYDLGQKLNCGGHLIALERTKAGMFNCENSVNLSDIKSIDDVNKNLINPVYVLPHSKYILNDKEYEKVVHGMAIEFDNGRMEPEFNEQQSSDIVFLLYGGKMIATGIKNSNLIKVKKVFEVL